MDNETSRRNILKRVGISAVALSSPFLGGTANAKNSEESNSIKASGISADFTGLFKSGEFAGATELLDKNNIEYSQNITEKSFNYGEDNTNRISTQAFFGEESSSFAGGVYKWDSDQYKAVVAADLELGGAIIDQPAPRDIAVIAWEGDIFGPVNIEPEIHTELTFKDNSTKDMSPRFENKPNDPTKGSHENAYIISLKDDKWKNNWQGRMMPTSAYAYFDCVLRKQKEDTKGGIVPKYTHTWSPLNIAKWNILQSISVSSGPVGVSVSLPSGADKWTFGEPYDK